MLMHKVNHQEYVEKPSVMALAYLYPRKQNSHRTMKDNDASSLQSPVE